MNEKLNKKRLNAIFNAAPNDVYTTYVPPQYSKYNTVAGYMDVWHEALRNGDPRVKDMEFVVRGDYGTDHYGWGNTQRATCEIVKGYSVYHVTYDNRYHIPDRVALLHSREPDPDLCLEVRLLSTYSPLMGSFIGVYSETHRKLIHSKLRHCAPLVVYVECSGNYGKALSDSDVLRFVYAEALSQRMPISLLLDLASGSSSPDAETRSRLEYYGLLAPSNSVVLSLVSLIKKLEPIALNDILNTFDSFGPCGGALGEALKHIDRFRSF